MKRRLIAGSLLLLVALFVLAPTLWYTQPWVSAEENYLTKAHRIDDRMLHDVTLITAIMNAGPILTAERRADLTDAATDLADAEGDLDRLEPPTAKARAIHANMQLAAYDLTVAAGFIVSYFDDFNISALQTAQLYLDQADEPWDTAHTMLDEEN